MEMSGVTGEGVTEVLRALKARIAVDRLRDQTPEVQAPWHP
jgi:GTP-binding protein